MTSETVSTTTSSISAQEVFDKTITHLRAQGVASWGAPPSQSDDPDATLAECCLYRGPNGQTCAVGHHIPDDLYEPRMEEYALDTVLDLYPALNKLFGPHAELLCSLQTLHDNHMPRPNPSLDHWSHCHTLAHFEVAAVLVAAEHGLTYTPPSPQGT